MSETTIGYCQVCGSETEAPRDMLEGLARAPGLIAAAVRGSSRAHEG